MPVKGSYLAIAGAGGLLLWSGLKGKQWSDVLRQLIAGKKPGAATTAYTISGTNPTIAAFGYGAGGSTTGALTAPEAGTYKAFALVLLAKYGWGNQFAAFNNIVMAESSWNPRIANPGSGAFGIAQALGHGTSSTRGTLTNMYGNYGTSDATCRAANSGNGYAQLIWMMSYIKEAYGSPNAAWAFHQAHGSY
jgi:hypothetical protein